ncbi:YopX family protein [Lacticaseibacillus paracasei]|uniref:YopX family protein n=1 Tax=Lacticaseibacillus paracasei TaxID=1597 RepID=UPI0021A71B2B|nr:YopX family protein [Lacticaseibacillus paracasei]MCT4383958.1 hypothetical protein [Lacticaseibacillus paracasei]
MREIKFRAWDKKRKSMFVPDSFVFDENTGEIMSVWRKGTDGETIGGLDPRKGRLILMQNAGLKDKNGREIYEGDVLDIGLRNQDGKPVIAPVSYETYAAGYVLDNGGNGIWQRLTKDCEVIGNIFENPELLEGKHEQK